MDSVTIKTYLMDYIFDILDKPKFAEIFKPALESESKLHVGKELKLELGLSLSPNRESRRESDHLNIFAIFNSFLVCIKKLLQLMFMEEKQDVKKLYDGLYDRLGENILQLISGSYMDIVRGLRRDTLEYHISKKRFQNMCENVYSV